MQAMGTTYAKIRGFARVCGTNDPTFAFLKIEGTARPLTREEVAEFFHSPVEDVSLVTEEEYRQEMGDAPMPHKEGQDGIKAVTLWQPYGALLVHRDKCYETRGWSTKYRGPIAIHAAQRPARQLIEALLHGTPAQQQTSLIMERLSRHYGGRDALPTGAIIGIGRLVDCIPITEDFLQGLSQQEIALGDFTLGRYAWAFEDLHEIEPIPAKGQQGLWTWRGKV